MAKTHNVDITQSDIDAGWQDMADIRSCPVARGIRRGLDADVVEVAMSRAWVDVVPHMALANYLLDENTTERIAGMLNGEKPSPWTAMLTEVE